MERARRAPNAVDRAWTLNLVQFNKWVELRLRDINPKARASSALPQYGILVVYHGFVQINDRKPKLVKKKKKAWPDPID